MIFRGDKIDAIVLGDCYSGVRGGCWELLLLGIEGYYVGIVLGWDLFMVLGILRLLFRLFIIDKILLLRLHAFQ